MRGGWRLGLLGALVLLGAAAGSAPRSPYEASLGIYVIGGSRPIPDWGSLLQVPGVVGVALDEFWETVEPTEGAYDWTLLDARVAVAAKAGRSVNLRLLPGISTPSWVYKKGAAPFSFVDTNPFHGEQFYPEGHHQQTLGKSLQIPVPWDPTFEASWERTVAAMGSHFAGSSGIAMVHVTGPNTHSAEMHLPRTDEDRQAWQRLGYTDEKLLDAWKRSIDAWAQAFPKVPLAIDLSPTIFKDKVTERVARYGIEKYGQRFFLQNDILLAESKRDREDWDVLARSSKVATIGFQRQLLRLGSQGVPQDEKLRLRRANFEGMFTLGLSLGARYFEVGVGEVKDFPEVVSRFAKELAGSASTSGSAEAVRGPSNSR